MRPFAILAMLGCLSLPAAANDGFGGLSATGLTFGRTDAVAMEEENLFIGIDRITVDYVFRNTSAQDVTGEVIFPLPPISVWALWESNWNLPEDPTRDNLVNFTAVVDGAPVAVKIDRVAVLQPPWEEDTSLSEQYDTPGRDVTAELVRFGIPLTLDVEAVRQALLALTPEQRVEVKALGLADFYGEGTAENPDEAWGYWSVVLRYHWTQTFPTGKAIKVSHAYEHRPAGGLFGWQHPAVEDYELATVNRYCIDEGTSAAIAKLLTVTDGGETYSMGMSYNMAYVLRTANSWAGPIGKFRLTLDKGDPRNIISLCAEGVKKTGPTTFVVEKTNYTPERDLEILVAVPMQ